MTTMIMIPIIETTKVAALQQSLAMRANSWYSSVTISTQASMAVFTNSKARMTAKDINTSPHCM